MKRTLTVFLCSTYSDLVTEREAVLDAVRRLQLQHDSMEFFGARSDQPLETCLKEVRKSDVLVVIVGYRYGTLIPDGDISFSHAEYDEGYRLRKPCLVYLRDENTPILPRNIERDPNKMKLLETFRATLSERHTIAKFEDPSGLAVQVTADLSRTIQALEDSIPTREKEAPQSESPVGEEILGLVNDAVDRGLTEAKVLSTIRYSLSALLASEGRRRPLVFLSYSNYDKKIVNEVANGLRDADIDIWLDKEEVRLGADIVDEVERGLDAADFMAYFISRHSMKSKWAKLELNTMMVRQLERKEGAKILPIRLDDADIPAILRDIKYLDLTDGDVPKVVAQLVNTIKSLHSEITFIERN